MAYAAIYVPDFPVAATVRAEPELREQAVAVVEGTPPLVHVVAVNERAAQAGIEPGMTKLQAKAIVAALQSSGESRVTSCELNQQAGMGGKIPTPSRPKEGGDKGEASTRKCDFAGEGARGNRDSVDMKGSPGEATKPTTNPKFLSGPKSSRTIRRRSAEREAAAHAALLDCACGFSPRVEDTAADTLVLDLAGLERIFGVPAKIARDVAQRCSEMGLEASVAVAANPDTAVLAARGFAGVTVIPEGAEALRLGELSVEVLVDSQWSVASGQWPANLTAPGGKRAPTSVAILETLERWGVRNLRSLAALPEVALAERLGQEGLRLQKLARGETRRGLLIAEPPLIFEEAAELEYPVETLEPLAFLLNHMLEQLCARLAARALATNELKLRLELEADTEDLVIENPAQIAGSPDHQITRSLRLPVSMLDVKVFLKLMQLDLQAHPPQAPVTKIWLRAEPAEPRRAQNGLFAPEAPEAERLEVTIARIKKVVGGSSEFRVPSCEEDPISPLRLRSGQAPSGEIRVEQPRVGTPEILDTHRADGFRMERFAAGGGARGSEHLRQVESSPGEAPGPTSIKSGVRRDALEGECAPRSTKDSTRNGALRQSRLCATTALRVFRPALAAVVTMREGKPTHVASPERPTLRGEVVWCAGPWRSSGEWWTEQAWSRKEWDVAVRNEEGVVLYRIYRDEAGGKWWVEGSYD